MSRPKRARHESTLPFPRVTPLQEGPAFPINREPDPSPTVPPAEEPGDTPGTPRLGPRPYGRGSQALALQAAADPPRVSSAPPRRDGRGRVPPGLRISASAMGQARHTSRLRRAIPANTGPDLHGHGGHEVSGLQIRRGLPRIRQGRTRQPRVPLVRPVGPGETRGQAELSTLSRQPKTSKELAISTTG